MSHDLAGDTDHWLEKRERMLMMYAKKNRACDAMYTKKLAIPIDPLVRIAPISKQEHGNLVVYDLD